MRIEIRYAVTEASLGGMALLQVSFAFLIELFRPRQHGNLDSSRAEVLKESGVAPRGPYAGKIRLSVRRPRCRGRQIRFSVPAFAESRAWDSSAIVRRVGSTSRQGQSKPK